MNVPVDLFTDAKPTPASKALTVFHAALVGQEETNWEELFAGYTELKAITFSSGLEFLVGLADRFAEMEIVFGSESILTKEHLALAQASQTIEAYGFADMLADQKGLTEALARLLGRSARQLLDRIVAGSLRFRLLRGRPSHEKLYLMSGPSGSRVVTGSANLSRAAFTGRQHEIFTKFDGEPAWRAFHEYYQRDMRESVAIVADALIVPQADGSAAARHTRLRLDEVPIVRVLTAGVTLIDEPPRPVPPGFTADALASAAAIGAELMDLSFPKDKQGRTVINASKALQLFRAHQARPLSEAMEDRIPRAEIDFATGTVRLDGAVWLRSDDRIPSEEVERDARLLADYLAGFESFFGDVESAVAAYWAFLVWLCAAPSAPFLRQAAVPAGIDAWAYPVYAVLYGRSSGGKTLFARVASRSMFGFVKTIKSKEFTTPRALGFRDQLGAIPLLIDDVSRDRFSKYIPDLVKTDQEASGAYAPIVVTTNKDVTTISPDLTKRMVTCHINAAINENRSVAEQMGRRIEGAIGTALYRAYLQRFIPEVRTMRAAIDADAVKSPELLETSADILRTVLGKALDVLPSWACPLRSSDYFGMRHRLFTDQLQELIADDRTTANQRARELIVDFGEDMQQARQFARGAPDFVFKSQIGGKIKLDLNALENAMDFTAAARPPWWRRLIGRGS
jgi:hypothetical protein